MAQRVVAVSVLQLRHADDVIRWVRAGDVVDVDGEDLERGDRLGFLVPVPDPESEIEETEAEAEVVEGPAQAEPETVVAIVETETAPAADGPQRPIKAAPVKAWEDYAVALFKASGGKQGLKREDAEASTKQDLIELFG